ncbi:MAG: transposase [Algibacter sp.]|uniref:transposase n=1 Tax=Algibacter sp. TaxID=1872428 RepID=UPI00263451EC|nr:transposase [Algibacter sp.]MDG1730407.1 transposase [Algibacter sp.]MDG2177670.1 transposase [Algibacter sp.]
MKYEPLVSDNFFHIYNCGNNKEDIFKEEKNYYYFLNLLKKYILPTCEILAYCLLKNHFHLLVKTRENVNIKEISQSYSNFFNSYSKSINKNYNRSGSLFKDRFSRIKIDKESYLKDLIVYIHLNPKHHGFTDNFKSYKYSSYHAILSKKRTDLERDYVLELFGERENFVFVHQAKQVNINERLLLE